MAPSKQQSQDSWICQFVIKIRMIDAYDGEKKTFKSLTANSRKSKMKF